MSNEVTIIVKDKDKTNFSKYSEKARTEISKGVKDGLDDVEKTTSGKFKDIGDKGGKQLGTGIRDGVKKSTQEIGADVSKTIKDGVKKVDVSNTFKEVGHRAGADITDALDEHLKRWSKVDFSNFGHDVEKGFGLAAKAGSMFGRGLDSLGQQASKLEGMWRLLPSAIIMGLQLLPAVASAAGGAITLALGGALAFIGLKAQSSNEQVKNAFSDMRSHVVSETKRMTTPFHDTLLHISNDAGKAFDSIAPHLQGTFAKIAPALTKFSGQFSASFSKLNPAIDSLGTAFDRVLASLGSRMGPIMNNFGTSIKAITDAVAANPGAFTGFVEGISKITRYTGDGLGILIRYAGQFKTFFETLNAFALGPLGQAAVGIGKIFSTIGGGGGIFGQVTSSLRGATGAADAAGGAMNATGMATRGLVSAQKLAAMTSDQLKKKLDELTGANQNAFDTQTQYREALRDAIDLGKKSNAGVDGNTAAADRNREALSRLAQTTKEQIENGHLNAQQIQKERQAFIDAAEGMGVSKARAKELADQLLGVSGNMKKIPGKKQTDLTAKDGTGAGVNSAKKKLSTFDKVKTAVLRAKSAVDGVVRAAASKLRGWAGAAYRANLTATSKVGGVVRGAISACLGFARRTYRATLSAVNRAGSALASALRDGYNWAGRVFSATFNVIKKVWPFAHGGVVSGYASGGVASAMSAASRAAGGGPRGAQVLVGEQGPELVDLPVGSRVRSNPDTRRALGGSGGGGGTVVLEIRSGGSRLDDLLLELLRKAIRVRGGNVQLVLGKS